MELREIFNIIWKRKWLGIHIFAAIFLTIVIGSLLITPWYDSEAKVLIRKSLGVSSLLSKLGLAGATSGVGNISDTERFNYIALSTINPVVEAVVEELQITRERIRSKLMKAVPFLKPVLKIMGVDVESTEEPVTAQDLIRSSLLSKIFPRPHVEVSQYEETDILKIEATSTDPEEAMKIAYAMAKTFIKKERTMLGEDFKEVKAFIDENIESSRAEYLKTLKSLEEFKRKEKFVVLDSEISNTIERISELRTSMENIKVTILKSEAAMRQVESQLAMMPKYQKSSEQIEKNAMIQALKSDLHNLYMELAGTKTRYRQDHPNVIDFKNKIAEAKKLLKKEVAKAFSGETISVDPLYNELTQKLASFYTEITASEAQQKALPKILEKYELKMASLPEKVSKNAQLQLALSSSMKIYENLLEYQNEVELAESMALSNIKIIELPVIPDIHDPRHRHPNILLAVIVAVFLGTVMGIGTIFLVEYLDDTIGNAKDIKSFKGVNILGEVVKLRKRDSDSIKRSTRLLKETFRLIHYSIKFAAADKPLKSFAVTSSFHKEGKSFFVTHMGVSLASKEKKILIIDGNMERPCVHKHFDLENTIGLSNYLAGDDDIKSIQISTDVDGLSIITTGTIPVDFTGIVESQNMFNLMKKMKDTYDLVILVAPPLLLASDAIVFGEWTEGTVIMIESGSTKRDHLSKILDISQKTNFNILGVVLNKHAN
jgi:capsular exopolysaccharide synthesis family protein